VNDALDWVTAILTAATFDGNVSPFPTLYLLRRYATAGQSDVRDVIEHELTTALETVAGECDPRDRCQWIGLFAEASAISDDERLSEAVQRYLPSAIDDLERFVRAAYEPGEGMLGAECQDQLRCASALLVAFELTGRLPYSMLAEELVQVAHRRCWQPEHGAFDASFSTNALAAQLMCRLAALHLDTDYTASAVVAVHPTYRVDADRLLAWLAPRAAEHGESAAMYGLALLDRLALGGFPN
jgi:hypothetical protein